MCIYAKQNTNKAKQQQQKLLRLTVSFTISTHLADALVLRENLRLSQN